MVRRHLRSLIRSQLRVLKPFNLRNSGQKEENRGGRRMMRTIGVRGALAGGRSSPEELAGPPSRELSLSLSPPVSHMSVCVVFCSNEKEIGVEGPFK
jgi:hypothetical protein